MKTWYMFQNRFKFKNKPVKIFLTIIIMIFVVFAATYSFVTPTFEGPDESFHFEAIENLKNGIILDEHYQRKNFLPLSYVIYSIFLQPVEYQETNIPTNWPVRTIRDSEVHNRFLHFDEETFPFSGTSFAVHYLRTISIGAGAITLFFIFKIGKEIFSDSKLLPVALVALVASIPKFIFMFSVINTEVFLTLFSIIAFYFLFKFAKNPSIKNIILIGIFSGFAVLTKINGLLVIVIVSLSFLILTIVKHHNYSRMGKNFLVFLGVMIIAGGWYKILKNITTSEINTISNPVMIFGERIRPDPTFLDIKTRLFDSLWGNLGWGGFKVVAPPGYIEFIILTLIISSLGLFLVVLKKRKLLFKIDRSHALVSIIIVSIFVGGLAYTVLAYNGGNGRNAIVALPFLGIGIITGISTLGKRKSLLIIPISIMLIFSVEHIQIIQNDLGYDFGNEYPYYEIIKGKGTSKMGTGLTAIQHGFMEGGKEGIYLFLHPQNEKSWWNYTKTIDNESKVLKFYYGFAQGPYRTEPVEFSLYINNEKIFSEKKHYTCSLNYFEKNMSEFLGNKVEISLSTEVEKSNYGAWAIWKPVVEKNNIDEIKPTHPSTSKIWTGVSPENLAPCEKTSE